MVYLLSNIAVYWLFNAFLAIFELFFFSKQKTATGMRISDWSSDVCSSDLGKPVLEIVMVLATVAYMFPLYIMISMSFKTAAEAAGSPIAPPQSAYFDNYATAWSEADLGRALIHSLIVTVISIPVAVLIGAMAGYAIVRGTRRRSPRKLVLFLLALRVRGQLARFPPYTLLPDLGILPSLLRRAPTSTIRRRHGRRLTSAGR